VTDCTEPLKLAILIDYWFADLAPLVAERVEDHLFGCASCTERLRQLVALTEGVRTLADNGRIQAVVTSAFLESVAAAGCAMKTYRLVPGDTIQCTITLGDHVVAFHLGVDLRRAQQVDLINFDREGREEGRLDDIPFNASAQEVVLLERTDSLSALRAAVRRMKLIGHEAGGQRLLAVYTLTYT